LANPDRGALLGLSSSSSLPESKWQEKQLWARRAMTSVEVWLHRLELMPKDSNAVDIKAAENLYFAIASNR
jgi:hypothetical protein